MFRAAMDRLGWQATPRVSLAQWDDLVRFARQARGDGLTRTLVCGMGGSSLAPQALAASFAARNLSVLDTTDPATVLAVAPAPAVDRPLFLLPSQSGSPAQ